MIYRHQWKDHESVYNHSDRGFCKIAIFESTGQKCACLHDLVVYPDRRGHGYGREMLFWAIQTARSSGCDIMFLFAEGELWVKEWYTRTGFVESDFVGSEDGGPCLLLSLSNEK